ncbi:MAG TPA: potassium channel family protein [Candidatus Saccharimonadales bacterium]|nr:potassium channel family protein [Candidatus Saccharimonadales bacterium]
MTASLFTERRKLLTQINDLTDRPLLYLSFIWLAITIAELTGGVNQILEITSYAIWALFIADFLLELTIAPSNKQFLKENWLIGLSLLLPALRILRMLKFIKYLRLLRSLRSLNLIKIIASLNRNISGVRMHAQRFGVRYVFLISSVVVAVGAAGILNFERPAAQQQHIPGMDSYGDALWWTVMMMTTIGSEYIPRTTAGRLLAIIISFYAIAIFGYVTAILASLLIEKKKTVPQQR